MNENDILKALDKVLEQRKSADPESSYVSSLYANGLNKILEKVGEEATETIIAAKDCQSSEDLDALVYETADLWFHTLVMLSERGGNSSMIINELARRFDLSGLEEKANRNK